MNKAKKITKSFVTNVKIMSNELFFKMSYSRALQKILTVKSLQKKIQRG
jgi:hypothetical protein